MKFDDCPALSARYLEQETPLENIISYEDALRNDISVGEKALVPFRDDGKYGPATVVGGYDLRNADHKGKYVLCFMFYLFCCSVIYLRKCIFLLNDMKQCLVFFRHFCTPFIVCRVWQSVYLCFNVQWPVFRSALRSISQNFRRNE